MKSEKGNLFIISGPSGVGKTILAAKLRENNIVRKNISHTTRKPRSDEIDGVHYFFIKPDDFNKMKTNNEFLETAIVFGNFYGTEKKWVMDKLNSGQNILLILDVQGAMNIKKIMPESVLIFINPPCEKTLIDRLVKRGENDGADLEERIKAAKIEMSHSHKYDRIVINQDVESAVNEIGEIIENSIINKRDDDQNEM